MKEEAEKEVRVSVTKTQFTVDGLKDKGGGLQAKEYG